MARKFTADVPFQTETRAAAKRRASGNTGSGPGNATSSAAALSPGSPSMPHSARESWESISSAKTEQPVRTQEPAPCRLPPTKTSVSGPRSRRHLPSLTHFEHVRAGRKKQATKKTQSKTSSGRQNKKGNEAIDYGVYQQVKEPDQTQQLVDGDLDGEKWLSSVFGESGLEPITVGNHTLTPQDLIEWENASLDFNDVDLSNEHLHMEVMTAGVEAAKVATGPEIVSSSYFSAEGGQWVGKTVGGTAVGKDQTMHVSLKDATTTHLAWTGRGVLAAVIASSGGLRPGPSSAAPMETLSETTALFVPTDDKDGMMNPADLVPHSPVVSATFAVGRGYTEDFFDPLSNEPFQDVFDSDLPSNVLYGL